MQDAANGFDTPMLGLERDEWLAKLEEIAGEDGHYQPLGPRHHTVLIEDKPILLVTFESIDTIQARGDTGQPLGFELVREFGWSHLCLLCEEDTWFRDPYVYAYFDRMADDGFFDEFERVIFYGAGPGCAYAAAAFSVAAPGATVITIQPQATLDPRLAGWDTRFPQMRRVSFVDRYGFAPNMVDAAEQAFVIYDPHREKDSIHAALFARDNVHLLPMPYMGGTIEAALLDMQILFPILAKAGAGKLTPATFYRLARARRTYMPYLNALMREIERQERIYLKALMCANVVTRMNAPRFLRKLNLLEKAARKGKLAS
ncbi:MAG: phosphoadenosine phosphosulfate reductase [Rhodobacteraceae bacterium]|nr:phosphoadenosine phosphosulfate reductase [Paracoccaceae bacterium]